MADEWTYEGDVLQEDAFDVLRRTIEDESDLLVEHRFYRGARAPAKFVCGDYGELREYIKKNASPGDSFYFWAIERCCTVENSAVKGRVPDALGRIPRGGAY